MKKVSILLTKRNDGEKIKRCLDSLINQTYPNLEILILDSGYRDSSMYYIYNQALLYNNIHLFTKKYASISNLRKLGLEKATGDYILFVTPDTTLNLNAVEVLMKNLQETNADIAAGSFFHVYYKHYLEDAIFDLKVSNDFTYYQRNLFSNLMLTTKLYKKNLFDNIKIRNTYFNEDYLNLEILKSAQRIVTTEKILFYTSEHSRYFDKIRFWENRQSFWYHSLHNLKYREIYYRKNKKILPKINVQEFLYFRYFDYLIWELFVYAKRNASIEELTMELYQVYRDPIFQGALDEIVIKGLTLKKLDKDELLANCILYADLLVKKITSLQDNLDQISIIKICYMLFVKIFFRQNAELNTEHLLCKIREELTLNETKEAKYVNGLNL